MWEAPASASEKFRTAIAWILAVVSFGVMQLLTSVLGEKIGVPVAIDVDPYTISYGRGVEFDSDSVTTAYGFGIQVLCLVAAFVVWHLVKGKQLASSRAEILGVLSGAILVTLGGIPLWLLFSRAQGFASVIGKVLELGLLAGSVYAGVQLTKHLKGKVS
jgi:hypothetical protein